jgi:hypothetical protein
MAAFDGSAEQGGRYRGLVDTDPQQEGRTPAPEGQEQLEAGTGLGPDGLVLPNGALTSGGSEKAEDDAPLEPLPFQQWIKRSASGAVLTGIALGLQQVYQPKRELPAFVIEATGEPEDPNAPITLHFDPDDPTKTVAVIRTPASGATSGTAPDPGV